MKRLLFLFIYLSSLGLHTSAQTFSFDRYTIDNGISNSYITCIIQDRKGFIWIGTLNGLNRFDGYKFEIFRYNPLDKKSIGGNYIRCLYEDKKGNLWIGLKDGGLSMMNCTTGEFTNYVHIPGKSSSLSYNDVAGICEDRKGNLWLAVDRGGLDLLDPATGIFKHYTYKPGNVNSIANNASTAISIDSKGHIWIAAWDGGITKFDPIKEKFFHYMNTPGISDNKLCRHALSLYFDKKGILWVGTFHGGLYRVHPSNGKWEQYSLSVEKNKGINHQTIQAITEDKEGNLWIATNGGGINIFNERTKKFTYLLSDESNTNSLLIDNTTCLLKDSSGSMWIGTSKGLNFYNPLSSRFTLYQRNTQDMNTLSGDYIQALLKDRNGNIWVASSNGLDFIESASGRIKHIEVNESNPSDLYFNKKALLEDRNGNIWIGSRSDEFTCYNPNKKTFNRIKIQSPDKTKIPYRNILGLYEDKDGSIWIASEIGAIRYNPQTKTFYPLFQSENIIYPEDKSHVIFRDSKQNLWIGTEGGLKCYNPNLTEVHIFKINPDDRHSIGNNYITSIYEDQENKIWIGTRGGLYYFNSYKKWFEPIIRPGEILGDPIMGVTGDKSGNLWLSSTIGLIKYTPTNGTFHLYDENDGLQSKEFNAGAFYRSPDGELFFGGINGFNSFYPDNLKENTYRPPVIISEFQIFNKTIKPGINSILKASIDDTSEITLKYNQSVVSFQFVALNYISSQKNQYSYILEGFDKEWITTDASRRFATYTNLDPGSYRFRVKASNNDGIWNETGTSVNITVLPPLWKTWWAYMIYIIIIFSLIYLLLTYFLNKERYKNQIKLAHIEAQKIHEIDQLKLSVFTNISHEFRTPLTLIIGPLEKFIHNKKYNEQEHELFNMMFRNSTRLMRLINQLLDYRKLEAGKLTMNVTQNDILAFINDVASSFNFYAQQHNIEYIIDIPHTEIYTLFDPDKLDKILYNLIGNAFNYTPENGKIQISVTTSENHKLHIKIKDNGIGIPKDSLQKLFTPFYQANNNHTHRTYGSGLGLAFTHELVLLHQGTINVESKEGAGSTFTVTLPLNQGTEKNKVEYNPDRQQIYDIQSKSVYKKEVIFSENNVLVLIIEDNKDMRTYIRSELEFSYRIIEAEDGVDGFIKAKEYIPDIIISDVMMPRMDGITLLKKLKKNDKTNHIPIILLTARHSEEHIIEGFESGVDEYIAKPFNSSILRARIENLLANRQLLWEKFQKSQNIQEIPASPHSEYIEKITNIVTAHISDPEFGVETFASILNMTTGQLSRKIRAIINTTPYNFIVEVRMRKAAVLLAEKEKNIAEIAFETGYQEQSNFTRAFTKFYGKTPSQYIKSQQSSHQ